MSELEVPTAEFLRRFTECIKRVNETDNSIFNGANTLVTEIEKGNTDHLESFIDSVTQIRERHKSELDQLEERCLTKYGIEREQLEGSDMLMIRRYLITACETADTMII